MDKICGGGGEVGVEMGVIYLHLGRRLGGRGRGCSLLGRGSCGGET